MPAKAVVFAILIISMICFAVSLIELVVPLAAKADMNSQCRGTLLLMEIKGGLDASDEGYLADNLRKIGFTDIAVFGSENAKFGENIYLKVEARYSYNRLMGLFSREQVTQEMVYDKCSVSRKVVN